MAHELRRTNALLRFYYHLDPDTLDDENWCRVANELKYVLTHVHNGGLT